MQNVRLNQCVPKRRGRIKSGTRLLIPLGPSVKRYRSEDSPRCHSRKAGAAHASLYAFYSSNGGRSPSSGSVGCGSHSINTPTTFKSGSLSCYCTSKTAACFEDAVRPSLLLGADESPPYKKRTTNWRTVVDSLLYTGERKQRFQETPRPQCFLIVCKTLWSSQHMVRGARAQREWCTSTAACKYEPAHTAKCRIQGESRHQSPRRSPVALLRRDK